MEQNCTYQLEYEILNFPISDTEPNQSLGYSKGKVASSNINTLKRSVPATIWIDVSDQELNENGCKVIATGSLILSESFSEKEIVKYKIKQIPFVI